MRKIILILFIFFYFWLPIKIHAADKHFETSTNSLYTVSESGITHVSETITITNKSPYLYTPVYSLTVGFSKIFDMKIANSYGALPFTLEKNVGGQTIKIAFAKRIVGVGKKNTFMIDFNTDSAAKKEGSVWKIDIPGQTHPEDFFSNTVVLSVPNSFGQPDVVKPAQFSQKNSTTYEFKKDQIGKSGVYFIFGNAQYYKFNLTYHLSNSNLFPVKSEIALTPSTNYQDISIKKVSPEPQNVYQDADGNWLAWYGLNSQES